jgi:hypothetical protein
VVNKKVCRREILLRVDAVATARKSPKSPTNIDDSKKTDPVLGNKNATKTIKKAKNIITKPLTYITKLIAAFAFR